MRTLKRLTRFYASHPWSTMFSVFWVVTSIYGAGIATGTPWSFSLLGGVTILQYAPNFAERITPLGPHWIPGWEQDLSIWYFTPYVVLSIFTSSVQTHYGIGVPAWLCLALLRLVATFRQNRRLRLSEGTPCTRCGYDITDSLPACPECNTPASTSKPTRRGIILKERGVFALFVAPPLTVMVVMALIGTLV